MILFLDGKRIPTHFPSGTTLASLLRFIAALPECQERAIDRVAVNGVPVKAWDESPEMPIPADCEIAVSTRPLKRVLLETVLSCRDYLPRLMQGCVAAATRFQQGRQDEALTLMQDIIDGLQWYNEVLGHVLSFRLVSEDKTQTRVNALGQILRELMSTLEERDFTLLADLLEYELVPELEAGLDLSDRILTSLSADLGNGPSPDEGC